MKNRIFLKIVFNHFDKIFVKYDYILQISKDPNETHCSSSQPILFKFRWNVNVESVQITSKLMNTV